jgi:hypothetical protein
VDFEVHEVDLANKSEEFLAASPTNPQLYTLAED